MTTDEPVPRPVFHDPKDGHMELPSPDGRFLLLTGPWEVRMSLWIETPVLRDLAGDRSLWRPEDSRWSLNGADWLDATRVELRLRKYPGNHEPSELRAWIDAQAGWGQVEGSGQVPLERFEAALDAALGWGGHSGPGGGPRVPPAVLLGADASAARLAAAVAASERGSGASPSEGPAPPPDAGVRAARPGEGSSAGVMSTAADGPLWRWQWEGYPRYHANRFNLALHLVVVPLFLLGNVHLLTGLLAGQWGDLIGGLLAMGLSLALQGRGHAREVHPPEPFTGPGQAIARILIEQWVSFPRFVLSGGWWRAWRATGSR